MSKINRDWIGSIWKAVRSGQGIDWADFEWYAIDHAGSVGMLTSAGPGPVPRSVFRDLDAYLRVAQFFGTLPQKGNADILKPKPRVDDWKLAAERGLYAFDYSAESMPKGYTLVARPAEPIHAKEVPTWVCEWLAPMALKQTLFSSSETTTLEISDTGMEWL